MFLKIQEWIESVREEPKRLLYILALGMMIFYLFRSCIPDLNNDRLPPEVLDEFTRSHVKCIGIDELQVWPGDHRQPECGQVMVNHVSEGTVPADEARSGITRAICFQVTVENPRWHTMAQTRHEIIFFEHTLYKVAVLKDGNWLTFPDEDQEDEQRWIEYDCLEPYGQE